MTKRYIGFYVCILSMLLAMGAQAAEFSASASASTNGDNGSGDAQEEENDGYLSEEKAKHDEANKAFWLGLGVRAGGGPNFLFTPDGVSDVGDMGVAPFGEGGGGLGGGGGAFIEMRFLKGHLGLELGIWNERNRTWTTQDVEDAAGNVTSGNKFIILYSVVHIPLMLEAHILRDRHRISFGLGPEFTIGLDSTDISVESDVLASQDNLRVKQQNDVLGAFSIGWGVKFATDWVVGLDLKATYNFTQPRDYGGSDGRVTPRSAGFEVVGSHTMDIRLILNFMWEIGFPR